MYRARFSCTQATRWLSNGGLATSCAVSITPANPPRQTCTTVLKAQRPAKQNQLFVGRSARQATQADGVVMMNAGRLIRNDGVYLICLPSGPPTAANDKKKTRAGGHTRLRRACDTISISCIDGASGGAGFSAQGWPALPIPVRPAPILSTATQCRVQDADAAELCNHGFIDSGERGGSGAGDPAASGLCGRRSARRGGPGAAGASGGPGGQCRRQPGSGLESSHRSGTRAGAGSGNAGGRRCGERRRRGGGSDGGAI